MSIVKEIFACGPDVVKQWLSQSNAGVTDFDIKELADICWTRAGTFALSDTASAKKWGSAALVGYDHLARHAAPMVAESAAENAAALRSWELLKNVLPVA